MKMHSSCLRFRRETTLDRYNMRLTAVVQSRLGVGARLVTGQHQLVYAVTEDGVYHKLPSWVQDLSVSERNRIW